jgi:hypothetical protein
VKHDFRFAGHDSVLNCMTCAHWRLQESHIKGVGKCALATKQGMAHTFSGPYAVCADYEQAHPKAVTKRKEILA